MPTEPVLVDRLSASDDVPDLPPSLPADASSAAAAAAVLHTVLWHSPDRSFIELPDMPPSHGDDSSRSNGDSVETPWTVLWHSHDRSLADEPFLSQLDKQLQGLSCLQNAQASGGLEDPCNGHHQARDAP